MSDDFNTVNIGRQQMTRELEVLRERYIAQRRTLAQLEAEAPSEDLAGRYRELQKDIDAAIAKLGELASPAPSPRRTTPSTTRIPTGPVAAAGVVDPVLPGAMPAAERPLRTTVATHESVRADAGANTTRLALMFLVAAIVLTALGLLVWKFAGGDDKGDTSRIVESTTTTATTAETTTVTETPAPASSLAVNPATHDFGVIRKGTRAVRQFRVENNSDAPIDIQIARSTCRCLWFDYESKVPAGNSTILAITVDGAKAKAGKLDEQVKISNKADPSDTTTVRLTAAIQ